MGRNALIIGSRGQDGRLLTELLQGRGDQVVGIGRDDVELGDYAAVETLLTHHRPHQVYYLAAVHQSSEGVEPNDAAGHARQGWRVNVTGAANVLRAVERTGIGARVFYASSSRVFGRPPAAPQTEATPVRPLDPYAAMKAAGMQLCDWFRREAGVHASCGILYNHESIHRGPGFVSARIARGVADIVRGTARDLWLRSLDAVVDWGDAGDYVRAMAAILDLPRGDDFVVASGVPRRVRDFAETAFRHVGLDYRDHVRTAEADAPVVDPAAVPVVGDPAKLMVATGWRPQVAFDTMVGRLVQWHLSRHVGAGG